MGTYLNLASYVSLANPAGNKAEQPVAQAADVGAYKTLVVTVRKHTMGAAGTKLYIQTAPLDIVEYFANSPDGVFFDLAAGATVEVKEVRVSRYARWYVEGTQAFTTAFSIDIWCREN
jgi:hypothetical protein